MEMLNNTAMFLANSDLWKILITCFANWVVNYGWAIILFTVCLKIVMSPLDVLQRVSSTKQTKAMAVLQPELNKLQEKYGNDREKLNAETANLYKKHNVNLGGMCFSLLITMTISLVVFFTLYSSLRSYGNEKLYTTYQELDQVCVTAQETYNGQENAEELIKEEIKQAYTEQQKQNSWLWVKNVWKGDTNTSQLVDFGSYANSSYSGIYNNDKTDEEKLELRTNAENRYNLIKGVVETENPGQNGYYVLIILSGVISFLAQWLSSKLTTPKGQKMNSMNWIMFIMIPVTMVILASTSNVIFTLYIIVNSIMTAIITTIITLIMKLKNKGNDDNEIVYKNKNVEVVEYSRNFKR